ncbi:hypothetical protein IU450_13715 [Nocardia abscessus]|uniref:hypothetical protein n=1 Tax=Nocardia abscessus TaxID=120957 RepID=UPI0018953644|nr:hypothetical protein [Nocardia abscessus]MBF6336937.1 hypothetical protein [Nocardia abscessus]
MTYDDRAEAEIAVLADVIAAVDAAMSDAARRQQHPSEQRAYVLATVLYELIASARTAAGPDSGRLYAAPILDSIIENVAAADELSLLDLLVSLLVTRHTATDP